MHAAATGMNAQQLYVDTIANNLANVNTTGYKKSKIEFQDLLYQTLRPSGAIMLGGGTTPTHLQVGCGTKPVATPKIFTQGDLTNTGGSLDLAITGDGFFQLIRPDGLYVYTRDGSFKVSADGRVVNSEGYYLAPEISFPMETRSISITQEGIVSVMVAGSDEPEEVGQLELARFINPAGLTSIGNNLYEWSAAGGDPILGTPEAEGFGGIAQGYVENSNVDVIEEMVSMIVAQRAYEINSKAIKTADDMMGIINNLKR
jgi:flagellar basal-body rod protein FlgG